MTSNYLGTTRGGEQWEPQFVTSINQDTCIGCGRCYKVCSRDVFDLIEREIDDEDEDFDDYDDDVVMVMALANEADCIGCGSCSKVCPKSCHGHTPAMQL
ncbi:ferredoxin III, nif-specific [Echinimonas agarilytica]|uniref:Ferredoxin III n=1 Tax=Echinimonas agarilytica TaxID=1215918 RepID=A0AA41W962_9GAMM|nr:ferredoxin III, nif-specific [Echinimonas agarilytica]MCM2680444.1 ferredoxin III, nif-specific [Echinimonas agarilytica]